MTLIKPTKGSPRDGENHSTKDTKSKTIYTNFYRTFLTGA